MCFFDFNQPETPGSMPKMICSIWLNYKNESCRDFKTCQDFWSKISAKIFFIALFSHGFNRGDEFNPYFPNRLPSRLFGIPALILSGLQTGKFHVRQS